MFLLKLYFVSFSFYNCFAFKNVQATSLTVEVITTCMMPWIWTREPWRTFDRTSTEYNINRKNLVNLLSLYRKHKSQMNYLAFRFHLEELMEREGDLINSGKKIGTYGREENMIPRIIYLFELYNNSRSQKLCSCYLQEVRKDECGCEDWLSPRISIRGMHFGIYEQLDKYTGNGTVSVEYAI